MLYRLRLPLLVFMFCLSVAATVQADQARFLNAIDGDSVRVVMNGRTHEVRLIGIDAPEWGQEYGNQAKCEVLRLCHGRPVRLEYDRERRDRYGRLLAYVYCDGRLVNEAMVRAGLAMTLPVQPNTRYATRLRQAQEAAKAKRQGFWLRGGLRQTPAQWRRSQ